MAEMILFTSLQVVFPANFQQIVNFEENPILKVSFLKPSLRSEGPTVSGTKFKNFLSHIFFFFSKSQNFV